MSEPAPVPPPRPVPSHTPRVHRLALYAALRVAAVGLVAGVSCAAVLTDAGALRASALGAVLALTVGVAAYLAVASRTARRLELARNTLRDARKRRFDGLSALAEGANRDELDALIQQVYRAGRALQSEIERLERVESYRREFLGDVSHELRTPIFAVSGFAETLLDGALEDDAVRRRFVERIAANARRLQLLTQDLAAISELEAGRLTLDAKPFSLPALAMEATEGTERIAAEREVSIAVRMPQDLPRVLADRGRIQQVLTNLVENAVRYNEPGGSVEVTARRLADGGVRVTVVDDGIGIPEEALPRLTDRFFRVDKSRSRGQGGTGLGLAIVKHILEAHGVALGVESRPGYGSSFAFTLPAVGSPELARRNAPDSASAAMAGAPVRRA